MTVITSPLRRASACAFAAVSATTGLGGARAFAASSPSPATPLLAYLSPRGAVVDRVPTSSPALLPNSRSARFVALSADRRAVYGDGSPDNLFLATSPWKRATRIDLPPTAGRIVDAQWAGRLLWLQFEDGASASLDLGTTAFVLRAWERNAISADGRIRAFRDGEAAADLYLEDDSARPRQAVFTIAERLKVFDVLRRQASPAARKLLAAADIALAAEPGNWRTGPPAVSPDGEALYWTTNLGGGAGAGGNTSWVVMKTNTADGHTIALARYGAQFGRLPDIAVSPDGRRLLLSWAVHSSAVENPVVTRVLDLASQADRPLNGPSRARLLANLQAGQCWATNDAVAFAGFFYDPAKVADPPTTRDFTLYVKSADDQSVRSIAGAASPACA